MILSEDESELVQLAGAVAAGSGEIDACSFDAAVAEKIGEARDIVGLLIIALCKKMAQIVWKDFAWKNAGLFGQAFHFCPDFLAREGGITHGSENLAVGDFIRANKVHQALAKFFREQDGAHFAFEGDVCTTGAHGFNGDV